MWPIEKHHYQLPNVPVRSSTIRNFKKTFYLGKYNTLPRICLHMNKKNQIWGIVTQLSECLR